MILQYKVISLVDNDSPIDGNGYREMFLSLKQSIMQLERMIRLHDDKSRRAHEKCENFIKKRNSAERRKPLSQRECAELLYAQKMRFFKEKENYLRKVGITATTPKLPQDTKNVERTIQRWDQYLLSDGEKGTKPPKGYSRERTSEEFDRWAETLEFMAYAKWKKKQVKIKQKNDGYDQDAIHSPEEDDDEYEEGQKERANEDMVDRFARTERYSQ